MYLVELHRLIENGENSTTEFKRKFTSPEKIAKELIAFANTKGGYILFGIDDDKSIVGVESEKAEIELVTTAAKFFCEPEVRCTTEIMLIKNKDVVVVNVEESRTKPHKVVSDDPEKNGRVYIRLKDESILASKETIKILEKSNPNAEPLKISFGDVEKALLKFLSENDKITVRGFKKLLNISERRASRTIVNLVRADIIRHHLIGREEYYTLVK